MPREREPNRLVVDGREVMDLSEADRIIHCRSRPPISVLEMNLATLSFRGRGGKFVRRYLFPLSEPREKDA